MYHSKFSFFPFLTLPFLILCFSLLEARVIDSKTPGSNSLVLSSPHVTKLGEWGEWEQCPGSTLVMGMRLKMEPYQGPLDDTGLNGIQFLCGKIGDTSRAIQSRRIQSLVGDWGSFDNSFECEKGYVTGFQLRSEPPQGSNDDTGANNLRIYCSGSNSYFEGRGLSWGIWTEPRHCPTGYAICSLRTQVQPAQGFRHHADDTSLNNLDVKCCEIS